ncbi:hypothetical protein ASPNIDRAFT_42269, partial [Aspergillus niger ATCC 1015]
MSFGFGVGDFLATLQLADDLKKRFAQAPSGFKAISGDVKSLWALLHDLNDIPNEGLSTTQKMELDIIVQRGREVLLEIEHKDLTLEIGAGIQSMKGHHDMQQRNETLAWICPVDVSEQKHRILSSRREGTGEWFLESEEFRCWISDEKSKVLLCTGAPGAGKTMLSSIAVDHFQQELAHNSSVAVAYHYFNYQERLEFTELLSSLLRQLLQGNQRLGITLEVQANRDDMESFLDGNLDYLPGFLRRKPELWGYIRNQILESADGIFLLVRLYYNLILDEKNERRVRALGKLQHAIAVEIGEPDFDKMNVTDIEEIVSACCGLITVDKSSNTAKLVHLTAQEYLKRTWKAWYPTVHEYLTDTCLTYVSFDAFDPKTLLESGCQEHRQEYPFYQYAATELGNHLRQSLGSNTLLASFIKNDVKVSRCMREMFGLSDTAYGLSGIHLASLFGLDQCMEELVGPESNFVNTRDYLGRTPLTWAAGFGNSAVVEFLLDHGAIVDSATAENFTPLFYAAAYGHHEVARLLIGRGSPRCMRDTDVSPYFWGLSCLTKAEVEGDDDAMEAILRESCSPGFRDEFHRLPLHWAASRGDISLVQRILKTGCDPNPRDIFGRTPLFAAICMGQVKMVEMLLEIPNIEPHIEDKLGFTPLQESYRRKIYLNDTRYNPFYMPGITDAGAWDRITDLLKAKAGLPEEDLVH